MAYEEQKHREVAGGKFYVRKPRPGLDAAVAAAERMAAAEEVRAAAVEKQEAIAREEAGDAVHSGIPPERGEVLKLLDLLAAAHNAGAAGDWILACAILKLEPRETKVVRPGEPDGDPEFDGHQEAVRGFFFELLDAGRYYEASALAWHRDVFEQRPWHVQRIFNALRDYDLVILMGGSKLSKTFGAAAWFALDWIMDPYDTSLRYATMEEDNLRTNLWANLRQLVTTALFHPRIGRISDNQMMLGTPGQRPECGLEAVLIPKSSVSSSKLKGCHPKNFRPYNHPLLGRSTRVRIVLDEAQALLPGVTKDFGSPKTSVNSRTRVMKIALTMNPEDEVHWSCQLAKPPDGFTEKNMDCLYDYTSAEGWRVCRLDARMHENVITRREIYPNQVTFESVASRMKDGADLGREFYTFCAGWPPPSSAADVVVPTTWFDSSLGEPIFSGRALNGAGGDIACLIDKAYLAVGRHGLATGWIDFEGKEHVFDKRGDKGEIEARTCVVLDELYRLHGRDPMALSEEIKTLCNRLSITAEFVAADETGVGFGTVSHMKQFFGAVTGVNFGAAATSKKILVEDKTGADGQVTNLTGEMYWTLRTWMNPQVKGFFINPVCSHKEQLKFQLTTRQYKWTARNMVEVEEKKKWMARNAGNSPDEADATVQLPLIFRVKGLQLPALQDEKPKQGDGRDKTKAEGYHGKTADVPVALSKGNHAGRSGDFRTAGKSALPRHLRMVGQQPSSNTPSIRLIRPGRRTN